MEDVSLKGFDALIGHLAMVREKLEVKKEECKAISAELDEIEAKLLAVMQASDIEKYSSKYGTLYRTQRFNVKILDRQALRKYLVEKGQEDLLSVNSNTLNSYYREEMANAVKEGAEGFSMPGVSEPSLFESIALRKS